MVRKIRTQPVKAALPQRARKPLRRAAASPQQDPQLARRKQPLPPAQQPIQLQELNVTPRQARTRQVTTDSTSNDCRCYRRVRPRYSRNYPAPKASACPSSRACATPMSAGSAAVPQLPVRAPPRTALPPASLLLTSRLRLA